MAENRQKGLSRQKARGGALKRVAFGHPDAERRIGIKRHAAIVEKRGKIVCAEIENCGGVAWDVTFGGGV